MKGFWINQMTIDYRKVQAWQYFKAFSQNKEFKKILPHATIRPISDNGSTF